MRILLINEHSIPGHHNEYELEQSGYNVDIFHKISDGYAALKLIPYSAVIKDITTPDEMELTMLHQWRKKNITTPLLVITGVSSAMSRAEILNAGADDCMQTPVVTTELVARLRAIVRRRHDTAAPVLSHRDVSLDTGSRTVTLKGKVITLTARETTILEIFLLHRKRLITREFLHAQLSTWQRGICSNVAEVHISSLRRKLGQRFIITLRGHGYRLNNDGDGQKSEEQI
ncbi:response regulator transcription factor [Salmonella enterica]|nr:response regulator transcription factor [Salmonella enterica]ELL3053365.1 response regulator transcription factor [Salmonella enterica]